MAGNSVIFRIIHQVKALQTPMNYLLLNIAILDIVSSVFFFFSIVILTQFMEAPSVLNIIRNNTNVAVADGVCKSVQIMWLSATVSPGLLTLIAFERYVAVVFPFKRNWHITRKRLRWLVSSCWLLGIALTIPEIVDAELREDGCAKTFNNINNYAYSVLILICTFVFPAIAIFFMYTKTIQKIWKKDQPGLNIPVAITHRRWKEKKRTVAALFTITSIFFVVFGIGGITFILETFQEKIGITMPNFAEINMTLFIFNSAVNPAIYFTCVKCFRDKFVEMIGGRAGCCAKTRRYDMRKARENKREMMTSSMATVTECSGHTIEMELTRYRCSKITSRI
ncbi:predicted protein [Nematostella vectensis]|uniref:G-protein coupled receptors family 1 profile domain-containing protein n=1 Tax=Nematostella vectensis TaxID=45351 RepID=A7SHR8_NEMVE|nr:predicted protein [Nematostella vectensis]|eukprot:XP_001628815.1 predicted protein [Nematostella vectensis]